MTNKALSRMISCAEIGIWWQDPSVAAAACKEAGLEGELVTVCISKAWAGDTDDAITLFEVLLGYDDYEFDINSETGAVVTDCEGREHTSNSGFIHSRSLMIATLKAYRNKVYGVETYVVPHAVAKLIAAQKG